MHLNCNTIEMPLDIFWGNKLETLSKIVLKCLICFSSNLNRKEYSHTNMLKFVFDLTNCSKMLCIY